MISPQKVALDTNIENTETPERLLERLSHMISPQKMVLETNFACHRTLGFVLASQAHQQKVVTCDQLTKYELNTNFAHTARFNKKL